MKYYIELEGKEIAIDIVEKDGQLIVRSENGLIPLDSHSVGNGFSSFLIGGKHYDFHIKDNDEGMVIDTGSSKITAIVLDEREKMLTNFVKTGSGKGKLSDLRAPMPGLVVSVEVEPGQAIKKGDGLIIIEAMKMENELKAARSVKVKQVKVTVGQTIEKGAVLITFE